MGEFFVAGGWSMWFVLFFSVASLAVAAHFAIRPDAKRLPTQQALTVGTVFGVLTGVATDLAAVCTHVPNNPEWAHSPDLPLIVMQGIAESLTPAILGFSMLSLAWMITAVGQRRLAAGA